MIELTRRQFFLGLLGSAIAAKVTLPIGLQEAVGIEDNRIIWTAAYNPMIDAISLYDKQMALIATITGNDLYKDSSKDSLIKQAKHFITV